MDLHALRNEFAQSDFAYPVALETFKHVGFEEEHVDLYLNTKGDRKRDGESSRYVTLVLLEKAKQKKQKSRLSFTRVR